MAQQDDLAYKLGSKDPLCILLTIHHILSLKSLVKNEVISVGVQTYYHNATSSSY